jgi:hypothetical protein
MTTLISYVYADLIEASLKTGTKYKTFEQVPKKSKKKLKILTIKGFEVFVTFLKFAKSLSFRD